MLIIGINAYHGDASAAAVVDGRLVAAAEEERFNRIKHAAGFPSQALRYVLDAAGASPREIDVVAIARDPWARLWRKACYALKMPGHVRDRLTVQTKFAAIGGEIARAVDAPGISPAVSRVEHHKAHLASAFLVSPFDEAALFSVDGLGDFASSMWGVGRGDKIQPMGAVAFPHSLGIYYTALTQFLGFPRYGDEYKVMGLASYGEPELLEEFRRIVIARNGGRMGFELNPAYFVHHRSRTDMTWDSGEPVLGRIYSDYLVERLGPPRAPADPIADRHRAIAASTQRRLEEVILERLTMLRRATGMRKLCIAGGVAFNCAVNGKILEQTGFDDIYIQPAAGDAGLAIGAAMYQWHASAPRPRQFVMDHAYWGPEFRDEEIAAAIHAASREIERLGCEVRRIENEDDLIRFTAQQIANGSVVGWFQGRMEWGPRALGNRSILADPRRAEMRDILNAKIKRREMFRPFAPSILEEAAQDYFTQSYPSPFMLMAYGVRPEMRPRIPATTHIDGTGRLQTVSEEQNPLYYRLIREFGRLTGVPVLLNTSFNENEPVVCAPEQALDCFLRTNMDLLVMGDFAIMRNLRV
ncbi:MAG TPA: carbamoyltransferase C-terminal domain-containing protein [Candidatus Binataceae bacterium]|nr:carbamoyltransferase C-terminal domain-containing protein [Candidatus Binataceae bacterium]